MSDPVERESVQERALSRIPFDPRDARIVEGMSRWMGLLGRFQVLAGGALMLTVMGIAIAYGTTEALATPSATQPADATPPLITLGEVTLEMLLGVGLAVSLLGALLLWGGVMLIDGAEDLERVVHGDELDRHHLENALRRIRGYYRIEALFTLLALAALLAWAIPGWA